MIQRWKLLVGSLFDAVGRWRAIAIAIGCLRYRRNATYTLIVREPLSDRITMRRLPADGRSLFAHLYKPGDDGWKNVRAIKVLDAQGTQKLARWQRQHWHKYRPRPGETIEIYPGAGAKAFTEAYIARLNAKTGAGVFIKAAIVDEAPGVKKYFCDHPTPITFDGNTYEPLNMSWQDYELTTELQLPTMRVTVPNIGGEVIDYVQKINILERDVTLQLLNLDLLNDVNAKDEFTLQIQAIEGDDWVAVFTLGMNLGFQDDLPRRVVTKKEFPGVTDTTQRFTV